MNGAIDDEMLMAYADGELDEASARAVAKAVSADRDLARRLAVFEESAAAVRGLFEGPMRDPVPEHLVAAIMAEREATVVPFRRRVPVWDRAAWPLAACLALALGLAGGWSLGNKPGSGGGLLGDEAAVVAGLANQASGGDPSDLQLLGSYRVGEGVCRVFSLARDEEAVRGIGCDRGSGYAVELVARAGSADAFSPASEDAVAAIDAFLDAEAAVGPLSLEEEASLLRAAQSGSR